jgi:hypothetical protein
MSIWRDNQSLSVNNDLDRSDRRKFDEIFHIPRLYISSCSYAAEPVRLYPTVLAYVNSALLLVLLLLLPMRRYILRLFETQSSLPPDCTLRFGSRGVSAFDTRKPITAPMTITGKRSGCPPISPSKRAIVRGSGKTAHATPAIPAVTATPSGMNVRILEIASPSVPPMKINGKMGPPSKPVTNDVLVSKALTSIIRRSNPMPKAAGLCKICSN